MLVICISDFTATVQQRTLSPLTNRTATQYDRLLASSCCPSVCLWHCAFWISGTFYLLTYLLWTRL